MPKFNPESVQERSFNVPNGDYPFVVVSAEERISKNNNEMISLQLECDVKLDSKLTVYENLVFTEKAMFRVKQFCESTGLMEQWQSGELEADDCLGAEGIAHLEKGEKYMEVAWFVPQGGWSESPTKKTLSPEESRKRLDGLKAVRSQIAAGSPSQTEHDDIPF